MTLWPAATAFAAPMAGRLADKVSTAWLCALGGISLAAGLMLAALWPSLPAILAGTVLCGAGFGFFQTPNNKTMLLAAPRDRSGAAGGMQGTARLSGQTAGALLMTVLFALAPAAGAPRLGLALAACFALAAGAVSFLRISSSAP
jgi:DHA2 family multidrug resistance protein-like MFS transporter